MDRGNGIGPLREARMCGSTRKAKMLSRVRLRRFPSLPNRTQLERASSRRVPDSSSPSSVVSSSTCEQTSLRSYESTCRYLHLFLREVCG